MMVPRNRLLFWVAMVLPFAAVGMMVSSMTAVSLALMAMLMIVASVDAVLARGQLHGIHVELPPVVRLSKDREKPILLLIHNELMKSRGLRVGLPFPKEIHSPHEDFQVILPENVRSSQFSWPCTPSDRGTFHVQKCCLETQSPMGFWNIRGSVLSPMEIRVYPSLMEERKRLAALFLNRGNFGIHAQRMVGQGRDFEKLREYIPGDGYDAIHWKATAKRGYPVTKIFQVERTQEVYVIIDFSRLSGKEIRGETALERFIISALVMGLVAEQQGDLFGLLTFSDRVRGFVRAKNGRAHYDTCRDTLYMLQPQMVTPDFEDVCSFIRLRLRRRSLLIFLTDLDDPVLTESLMRHIDLIGRQHLILVGTIKSREVAPIFQSNPVHSIHEIYQNLGGHLLWHHMRELEKKLKHHGVRLLNLDNEKMSAQLVSNYLSIKQRQLL